jgi:hypothetical protein
MKKTLAIAVVLTAAALTGILSTNPIAFTQDESETNRHINDEWFSTARVTKKLL